MRLFEYRAPRFFTDAKFSFMVDETSVPGTCTNVSRGGVRALLEEGEPTLGGTGRLVLTYLQHVFTLVATVTHLEGREVGFTFVQANDEDRRAAADFAAFLETQMPQLVGRHIQPAR